MDKALVLIIEDEVIIAQDLAECLSGFGYEIAGIASSFDEAVKLIEEKSPDVILVDIVIKGDKDGIETAKYIRENYDLPLLFLTSHSDHATVKRAVSIKPNGYLTKPFKEEDVFVAIETALSHFQTVQNEAASEFEGFTIKNAMFIRHKNMLVKLKFEDIGWLKAEGNYTEIWSNKKKYVVRNTLKEVEHKLPENEFLRIHKSFIVRIESIEAIHVQKVIVAGIEVPISRTMHELLLSKITLLGHID